MFKIYRAIMGSKYFIAVNVIIPILMIIIGLINGVHYNDMISIWCFCAACLIEIASEYFGLGPIYRKRSFGMNYLKTAYGGMDLFRKAIIIDSILRAVRCLVYIILPAMIVVEPSDYKRAITAGLILGWVSVWSVNLTRYISIFSFMFISNIPFMVPAGTMYAVARMIPGTANVICFISIILLITGFVFSNWLIRKKINDSYKDI